MPFLLLVSLTAVAGEPRLLCSDADIANGRFEDCAHLRERLVAGPPAAPLTAEQSAPYLTRLVTESKAEIVPSTHGSVKVMSQNVGTAAFAVKLGHGVQANCPNFKLCDPEIIEAASANVKRVLPDVIFFAEAQGEEQLLGSALGGPVLPQGYDAVCTYGHRGVIETCLAWNTARAKLAGICRSIIGTQSGVVSCPLIVDGTTIQFVSAHPSAWVKPERQSVLQAMWAKLVDRSTPVMVGGDFNTETGTFGFSDSYPYPADFGTLFGRQVADYGRWPAPDSFFGHYHWDSENPNKPRRHRSTILTTRIDHVFSNFGQRQMLLDSDNACKNYSCLGDVDEGFEWHEDHFSLGRTFGARADHRPILARLSW